MPLRFITTSLLLCLLAGCAVGPDYVPPEMDLPPAFGATTQPATRSIDFARWWTSFQDPQLNTLIDRAVAGNLDLKLADARLREARAARRVVAADFYPGVNTGASYRRSRSSENAFDAPDGATFGSFNAPGTTSDLFQAGFDASWELDVFGGTRRGVEAAEASIDAAVEARRDALVSVLAEVARNYLELRGFQQQIKIADENLKVQLDAAEIAKARARAASDLDLVRAEAQVSQTRSTIPLLQQQRDAAAHRLGVLLGQAPRALIKELEAARDIPKGPPAIPPGLPSELLRRRPDIRRAERELAAATARIGVATADLFPRFSLTGSLGLQAHNINHMGDWPSRFWSIGPSVSWPIFDAGRIRANVDVTSARQQQALVQYKQTVLAALADVETALTAYDKEQSRRTLLAQTVEFNRRAVELSKVQYQAGTRDFLNVIDAERQLLTSEDALVQSDRTISTNLVALYKALGGGWTDLRPATQPSTPAK